MTKKPLLAVLILAVFFLHQDFWNWNNGALALGFLPVGLAYHACYALAAAALMAVLVKLAWPADLEPLESRARRAAGPTPDDEHRKP